MKKIKIIVVLTILLGTVFSSQPIFASEDIGSNNITKEQILLEYLDPIFQGNELYEVTTKDKLNVLEKFKFDMLPFYELGDIKTIDKYIIENDLVLSRENHLPGKRDFSRGYSKEFLEYLKAKNGIKEGNLMINYRISGNATCTNDGRRVTGYSQPTFTLTYREQGLGNTYGLQCYATASGGTVTINCSFTYKWTVGLFWLATDFSAPVSRTFRFSPGNGSVW